MGGAIFILNSGNFSIINCIFLDNSASQGGAIYYDESSG